MRISPFRSNKLSIFLLAIAVFLVACQLQSTYSESASYKRFREGVVQYEKFNEFNVKFEFAKLEGFDFAAGVERYYPSSIIQEDGQYHMWYSKPQADTEVVGPNDATDTLRAFHWDLSEVWYATSTDGIRWQEQGRAIGRGPAGRYDHRSVFNPEILVAKGKYYLVYQAAESLEYAGSGDFVPNVLGMSVADTPAGPWTALDEPVLVPGPENAWDGEVIHEPTFFVKGGKYFLYYKSNGRLPWKANITPGEFNKDHADIPLATGVAISDHPEGPYIRSEYNPVLMGGHGGMVWPYRSGVCATFPEGPERNSILCAEDGINFYPMIQGLSIPWGGGAFRPGKFTDVNDQPGQGITWGVSHKLSPYYHFVRFEADLSLDKGNRVREEYQLIQDYISSDGDEYDSRLEKK